jgi:hypothetical protein
MSVQTSNAIFKEILTFGFAKQVATLLLKMQFRVKTTNITIRIGKVITSV